MGQVRGFPTASITQPGVAQLGVGVINQLGVVGLVKPANEIWVDDQGDDVKGDGSQGNPWKTLVKAFTFATANPFTTVRLPAGNWSETVGIPPTNTLIVGENTLLRNGSDSSLTWQEVSPTNLAFQNVQLVADITGKNGGDLQLSFLNCAVSGVHTLVGLEVHTLPRGTLPTFVNCSSVRISSSHYTFAEAIVISYDPITATNGSNTGHHIEGGLWTDISYNATDPGSELILQGVVSDTVTADGSAIVRCKCTKVLTSLNTGSGSLAVIEYDQPLSYGLPGLSGNGTFKLSEISIERNESALAGERDVVLALPRLPAGTVIQNVQLSCNLPGTDLTWVSNTDTSLTIHTKPPSSNPAYIISVLVKP